MIPEPNPKFMALAVELAVRNVAAGGGPFGALVAKDGVVIAQGANAVTLTNDPTAHAEIVAIRAACAALGTFQLEGCEVYCSCEPCPMCLGALYWARPAAVYYAATSADAAAAGFDDRHIYEEIVLPLSERTLPTRHLRTQGATEPFDRWKAEGSRTEY